VAKKEEAALLEHMEQLFERTMKEIEQLFERRVTPRFGAIAQRFDAIDKKFGLWNKGLDSSTETLTRIRGEQQKFKARRWDA
jgi:putative transposon-encoded protein